jgi:hypothetical protein
MSAEPVHPSPDHSDPEEPMMAPTSTPDPGKPPDVHLDAYQDAYSEAATRIRDMNERLIESAKVAGLSTLDAYEKVLRSLLDFEQKLAGATHLDWVSALAQTHASMVRDLTVAYSKAARELFS